MPNPQLLPLTRGAGNDTSELPSGYALDGSAKVIDLLPLQSGGLVSGVLGATTTVNGSDFVWAKDYLPAGRLVYLETFASGSALTTQVTVTLNTLAGATVATTTTTNTTAGALARSPAISLTDGVTYQLRFNAAILGTATLKLARLIIL
jgi:hypothetical protein